jgi:hypothetical protein
VLSVISEIDVRSTLRSILSNTAEEEYFRADALKSIYQIDPELGRKLAPQFQNSGEYFGMVARTIPRKEEWLTQPSEE